MVRSEHSRTMLCTPLPKLAAPVASKMAQRPAKPVTRHPSGAACSCRHFLAICVNLLCSSQWVEASAVEVALYLYALLGDCTTEHDIDYGNFHIGLGARQHFGCCQAREPRLLNPGRLARHELQAAATASGNWIMEARH